MSDDLTEYLVNHTRATTPFIIKSAYLHCSLWDSLSLLYLSPDTFPTVPFEK